MRVAPLAVRAGPLAVRAGLLAVTACAALSACTSSGPHTSPTQTTTSVITETIHRTQTVAPSAGARPRADRTVAPLPPGQHPPKGEVEKACPYLRAGLNIDPTSQPNVADLEGDRVGRVTVLPARTPVGCRFYFANPGYEAVADILPTTYPTAAAAHAALVALARTRAAVEPRPHFVPAVDGIRFRTAFFGPDHGRDWAFAFAKGRVLVVVHTQQDNVSLNAERLAAAIVGKF